MEEKKLLICKKVQLEKFPGKGGWTYARLPEVSSDKNNPFGWRKVKGYIDDYEINQYHLMPMGNGELFLPVKAAIRKIIKKQEGDYVDVEIYEDKDPLKIPEEFVLCLKDEPHAWKNFQKLSEQDQKKYISWIYAVKTEDLKVERMAETINALNREP